MDDYQVVMSSIVKLDEMYDILSSEAYAAFRQEHRVGVKWLPNGSGIVDDRLWPLGMYAPRFYRHIIAEQLLVEDFKKIDWYHYGVFHLRLFFDLAELWTHPYVWCDAASLSSMIVEGRVAQEKYCSDRGMIVIGRLRYIDDWRSLDFAKRPRICGVCPEAGYVEGMHDWSVLTMDYEDLLLKAINEDTHITDEEINSIKQYDSARLRSRLELIAEELGGQKSAELLRMLQKEWPLFKHWKPGFETMTEAGLEQFEDIIFHGFDDLLAKWEAGMKVETDNKQTDSSRYCKYIVVERFIEAFKGQDFKIEDYENRLHEASKGTAKSFANVLVNGLKAGMLDFHEDDKKAIYNYFRQHFPDMKKYSYQNFSDALTLPS